MLVNKTDGNLVGEDENCITAAYGELKCGLASAMFSFYVQFKCIVYSTALCLKCFAPDYDTTFLAY